MDLPKDVLEEYVKRVMKVAPSILHKPGKEHLSQQTLLTWVNDQLKVRYKSVEQLGSGEAYCLMMNQLFPGIIPTSEMMTGDHIAERHRLKNFRLLQQAFTHLGLEGVCYIDNEITALSEGNIAKNYGFLKWFYKFYTKNISLEEDQEEEMEVGLVIPEDVSVLEEDDEMDDILSPHISSYPLRVFKKEEEIRILKKEMEETPWWNCCKKRSLRKQIERAVNILERENEKENLKKTLKRALSLESDEEDVDKLRKDIQEEKKKCEESPRSELKRDIAEKEEKLESMENDIRKLKTQLEIIDVGERTYYRNLSRKSSTSSYST